MKLSQLFSGETAPAESTARPQQSPAQTAYMNRQVRSLVPGQTISGEVLSKNGGEVQLKLSEDMILNARVDRNMNIEVGKNMTFEVKNNGSSLTLSPLFTNVSTDVNVLKALDMAGLPVNQTSVSMTEQLMQAGLPVNKSILQQVFREINSFPQGEISDVIYLHKLQLPVNQSNMEQMAVYRNLDHQLTEGMDTVLEALPEVFDSMVEEGDIPGAMRLYREVLELVREAGTDGALPGDGTAPGIPSETYSGLSGGILSGEGGIPEEAVLRDPGSPQGEGVSGSIASTGGETTPGRQVMADGEILSGRMPADGETVSGRLIMPEERMLFGGPAMREISIPETSLSEAARASLANQVLDLMNNLQLPEEAAGEIRTLMNGFSGGQSGAQDFFSGLAMAAAYTRTSEGAMQMLEKLFSGKEFGGLLKEQLRNSWTLTPEEVAVPGKVEEMYRRLDRQLRGISQALENAGRTDSAAFRGATAMSNNVDFLQQVNQMYTYVQLPLRLQQRNAQGELYVYTNKKRMSSREGTISALLHLDMENLGPVDVYVTMQSSKVNTKFYLRDEDMMDFLAAHMDILTERLKKRGYDCSFAMTTRENGGREATEGGLSPLLGQDRGIVLSQYAFDVRT